jgi:hypothetical protein
MPLMAPEKKTTNEQLNVTLPADTLRALRAIRSVPKSIECVVRTDTAHYHTPPRQGIPAMEAEHQAKLSALAASPMRNNAKPGKE